MQVSLVGSAPLRPDVVGQLERDAIDLVELRHEIAGAVRDDGRVLVAAEKLLGVHLLRGPGFAERKQESSR